MMARRHSAYYSDATEKLLGAYGDQLSRSALLARIVARYAEVSRRALPPLAPAEWELLVAALKERPQESTDAVAALWASIEDAVRTQDLDKNGKVDVPALLRHLRGMDYPTLLAVVDFSERYWAAQAAGEKLPWPRGR
jgi:hypothetical protein